MAGSGTTPLSTRRARAVRELPALTLLAGAAAALMPFVWLALHAFPSADDYCQAIAARAGLWDMLRTHYLDWTGRYTTSLLTGAMLRWDLAGLYPWFCTATLGGTFLAFRTLVGAVCRNGASAFHVTVAGVVATAVLVGGLPSTVEAFFWLSSSVPYQWGLIAFLAWLALLIRLASQRDDGPSPGRRAAALVLTIALPGFNEILAPVVLVTLAAFLAASWRRSRLDGFVLGLLGVAAALTAVSLLAPGNAIRSANYPDLPTRHALGFALVETSRQALRFLATHGWQPALWGAACAAWWWAPGHWRSPAARQATVTSGWLAVLGLLAVLYGTLFPLYWEYGAENYTGEGRTYNVTYLVLCATVVAVTGVLFRALASHSPGWLARLDARRALTDRLLAAMLALLLVAAPGVGRAFDASTAAAAYLAAQRAREAALTSDGNRDRAVFVDPVRPRPEGLFWSDIDRDPSHWINNCVAAYYGLASVQSH